MRPLLLDLVAFRSYDRVTVDWTAFDLVVIAGDTGAGKTSLLDSIAFALYGKTPEGARPKDLLTLGHTHGEVRLTFRLRAETWRVTRRFGPDAPEPAHLLERLEDADAQTVVESFTGGVDERVRALVGLSFGAFTSAVLLAQGRFAQFLGAQPRDRDAILRELFAVQPLESARTAALALKGSAEGRAEGLDLAAARLPAHDARTWWTASRTARAAAAALSGVRALREPARRIDTVAAEQRTAEGDAERARAARALLPDARDLAELAMRVQEADEALRDATREHDGRAAARTTAREARDALRDRHGGDAAHLAALRETADRVRVLAGSLSGRRTSAVQERAALDAATVELRAAGEAGTVRAERVRALEARHAALLAVVAVRHAMAQAEAAHSGAVDALATSAADHDRATAAHRTAQAALDAAQRADLAATLRAGLSDGDTCPVCGGAVGAHPHAPDAHAGDLATHRREVEDARGAERAAAARRAADAARLERAEADLTEARARHEEAAAALDGDLPDDALATVDAELTAERVALDDDRRRYGERSAELAEREGALRHSRETLARDEAALADGRSRLGEWSLATDPGAALESALRDARAAERQVEEADAAAARAAAAMVAARRRVDTERENHLGRLRTAVVQAAAMAGLTPPDAAEPADLIPAVGGIRDRIAAIAGTAADRAEALGAARAAAEAELARRGAPLGVRDAGQVEGAVRSREEAVRSARATLQALSRAADQSRDLRRDAADDRAEAALYAQVALDLQANRFPRHLLGRFRERLAAGASTRLQELSNGAYRFLGSGQDPLAVVDLRRGERTRSAATLSGGERFLASLALALGLSDIAAESGGRLDCLFLDEGFSTLDAESLEQAMAGVERLGGDGRLVAVITHLPGVAERLGAELRVTKDATGVSRIADAAPGADASAAAALMT